MNIEQCRKDFPIFHIPRDKPFIFLDSAASAQKPAPVLDAMMHFYRSDYANVHRGIYALSNKATQYYEDARTTVRDFIHAKTAAEIIFVKSTTDGINFIASTLSQRWQAGDEVIITVMEHHANIVPWLLLKKRMGIKLKIVPINDAGVLDLMAYQTLFTKQTKLVALTHVSNVLGTINPIKEMTAIAHHNGVPVLVDGAQAIAHVPVDVVELGCDFYTFSAHKLYGPTGVGVLYINESYHDLPPYQGGGNMIDTVTLDEVTFRDAPYRFEAGTPPIVDAIGLGAAIHYVAAVGMQAICAHDQQLLHYLNDKMQDHPDVRVYGQAQEKAGVVSFTMEAVHPHDIGTVFDHEGIAVRAGHHCCMPLMHRFNVSAMVRVSFGMYNTFSDIDALIDALQVVRRTFRVVA